MKNDFINACRSSYFLTAVKRSGKGWKNIGEKVNFGRELALTVSAGCGLWIAEWSGRQCKNLIPILESGIDTLIERAGDKVSPWENFENSQNYTAIHFLITVLKICKRHKEAFVLTDLQIEK